ncbi:hypothetical protein DL95DRAFT_491010 [Leptodontidium sp. 2 PMI_412]|nr:hypothetical protein DL95DRAFT_491010 [Leptodontidium sp. 2 PMI_412]
MAHPLDPFEASKARIRNKLQAGVRDLEYIVKITRDAARATAAAPGTNADLKIALTRIERLESDLREARTERDESRQNERPLQTTLENDGLNDTGEIERLKRRIAVLEEQNEEYLLSTCRMSIANWKLKSQLAAEQERGSGASQPPPSDIGSTGDQTQIELLKGTIRNLQLDLEEEQAHTARLKGDLHKAERERRQSTEYSPGGGDGLVTTSSERNDCKKYGTNIILTEGAIRDYEHLVNQIQYIVYKFYQVDLGIRPAIPMHLLPKQEKLLQLWSKGYTKPQLSNRMRSALFELLWEHILIVPWYNLQNVPGGETVEKVLGEFERNLEGYNKFDQSETRADWRTSTMKTASWIRDEYAHQTSPAIISAAKMMESFMAPLLSNTAPRGKVSAAFLNLCESAHALMLALRQERIMYQIELPAPGTQYNKKEHTAWDCDVHGAKKVESDFIRMPILFPLSGILVVQNKIGERVVLSPAKVVV